MKNIYSKCNNFYKIANLASDVANRILFPLSSRETFDFVAGRIVANGAINLLYFGIKAVTDELQHYEGYYEEILPSDRPNKLNIDTYIGSFKSATEMFLDLKNWAQSYGGEAWGKISKTLLEIAENYKKYIRAEKYGIEEEQAIRKLIIYMNKFDGLAHNTGSIYNKLLSHEIEDIGWNRAGGSPYYLDNLNAIENMRDMTESENVSDIIRYVAPYLNTELPFKDLLSKTRGSDEYHPYDPKRIETHIQTVKVRKNIKMALEKCSRGIYKYIECLNRRMEELSNIIKLNNNSSWQTHQTASDIVNLVEAINSMIDYWIYITLNPTDYLKSISGEIAKKINKPAADLSNKYEAMIKKINSAHLKIKIIIDNEVDFKKRIIDDELKNKIMTATAQFYNTATTAINDCREIANDINNLKDSI